MMPKRKSNKTQYTTSPGFHTDYTPRFFIFRALWSSVQLYRSTKQSHFDIGHGSSIRTVENHNNSYIPSLTAHCYTMITITHKSHNQHGCKNRQYGMSCKNCGGAMQPCSSPCPSWKGMGRHAPCNHSVPYVHPGRGWDV